MKKLNMFVGATTFGTGVVGTFNLDEETFKDYKEARVEGSINEPIKSIYEKRPDQTKIANWTLTNAFNSIKGHMQAVAKENKRVGSLNTLCVELTALKNAGVKEVITCNIPACLYEELNSGRIKYIINGEMENSYFSDKEIELWKEFYVIYQEMFMQLVFNPIEKVALPRKGEKITEAQPIRKMRIELYNGMRTTLMDEFTQEKAERTAKVEESETVSSAGEAFK